MAELKYISTNREVSGGHIMGVLKKASRDELDAETEGCWAQGYFRAQPGTGDLDAPVSPSFFLTVRSRENEDGSISFLPKSGQVVKIPAGRNKPCKLTGTGGLVTSMRLAKGMMGALDLSVLGDVAEMEFQAAEGLETQTRGSVRWAELRVHPSSKPETPDEFLVYVSRIGFVPTTAKPKRKRAKAKAKA